MPMSLEQNKANTRRFMEEVFNKGNLAVIDELLSTNFVDHMHPPGTPPGLDAAKQINTMMRAAFPDIHATVEDIIAEGDKVAVRATWTGTHKGEFMGMPPTGKSFKISAIDVMRIGDDGKALEHWGSTDMLGMMQQLGVIPTPGQQK